MYRDKSDYCSVISRISSFIQSILSIVFSKERHKCESDIYILFLILIIHVLFLCVSLWLAGCLTIALHFSKNQNLFKNYDNGKVGSITETSHYSEVKLLNRGEVHLAGCLESRVCW